jgi:hypothetical protein
MNLIMFYIDVIECIEITYPALVKACDSRLAKIKMLSMQYNYHQNI